MEQKDMQEMHSPVAENHKLSPSSEAEPLWTVADVARYLQLEPETVCGMAKRKVIPGQKVGRVWRFSRGAIVGFCGTDEPLWTVADVAHYLQLEPGTVCGMARRGELPGRKIGRVWRFSRGAIEGFFQMPLEKSQPTGSIN